jgi:hypothetical protein
LKQISAIKILAVQIRGKLRSSTTGTAGSCYMTGFGDNGLIVKWAEVISSNFSSPIIPVQACTKKDPAGRRDLQNELKYFN